MFIGTSALAQAADRKINNTIRMICFIYGLRLRVIGDVVAIIVLPENLVEHDLDVVAGVPVAVVIKAAGRFEDAGELHAARAQVVNVSLGVFVAVFKGALLLGLAP